MSKTFGHLGLFPFCFPLKDPQEIDLEVAQSTSNYSGSYAGSLFPLKCTLKEAMSLYWRIKEINLSASLVFDTIDYRDEATITSNATITEFNAADEFDSLQKRVCGKPTFLESSVQNIYESYNPPTPPVAINDIMYIRWFSDIIQTSPMFDVIGNILNIPVRGVTSDTWFYPTINFTLSRYSDTWTTYFPHYYISFGNQTVYTQTGQEKTIIVNIPEIGASLPMKIYRIEQYVDGSLFNTSGTATFSDWTVELWAKPQ